uniref:Uncharacterized protein n=1 Tax=Arundo donax TaxID=35708 RepID=A0A0A9HKG0_ARUDO
MQQSCRGREKSTQLCQNCPPIRRYASFGGI